ncbi:hypothetical protein B566_EDAN012979 [Ephemera danica]|nr:hypothetical protein B566_EDAN012979 [Ephemera danica]
MYNCYYHIPFAAQHDSSTGVTVAEEMFRFTRQQWFTIAVIGSVHFFTGICISIQAPFYPREAESKGASATEYGLVFGIYELTAFITCPLFGKYVSKIILDLVPGHAAFIALSLLVRITWSLGASAAITAAFAITASVFPDSVATTFAMLEVFYGFGFIAGPTIGGFLYVAGGYVLPFTLLGASMLLVGVFIFYALTEPSKEQDDDKRSRTYVNLHTMFVYLTNGILSALAVPAILVDSICIVASASAMGFYAATLEPHLRQLEPLVLSSMFVLSGATYAVFAPLVGYLCDRVMHPRVLTIIGCALQILGAILIGPAPFIVALQPSLGLCIAGLIIHGLGMALQFVSCFIDALREAIAGGFGDGLPTHGLVAGLWASSFSLGAFIGPSLAGVLFDMAGFRLATYFVLVSQFVTMLVVLMLPQCNKFAKKFKSPVCCEEKVDSNVKVIGATEIAPLINDYIGEHSEHKIYGTVRSFNLS